MKRRSTEEGHRRKFLVIIDDTPECSRALLYAARRAEHSGGALVLLYVIGPAAFQHWLGVENIMRAEAHEHLDGGHLVRLDCRYDPYRVYIATADTGGRIAVVGMTTVLAPQFGGDSPSRRDVDVRLSSGSLGLSGKSLPLVEGAVNEWLPFAVEEL